MSNVLKFWGIFFFSFSGNFWVTFDPVFSQLFQHFLAQSIYDHIRKIVTFLGAVEIW